MRFLQIVTSYEGMNRPAPDPAHIAKVRKAIEDKIARGEVIATGAIGKRATSAARVIHQGGKITVEDPPTGDGWMAGGGYSITEFASKEEAVAAAKATFDVMGEGVLELIQVSEMYPPPNRAPVAPSSATLPSGVVPYLTIEGASEAAAFYQRAFGAKEIARMLAQDGKRLMHCHLEINGGALMLADYFPDFGQPPVQRSQAYTMQLVVADGDSWWRRAIEAGCQQKLPFEVAPWGDKYGQLVDPFGVTWALNTPLAK